MAEVGDDIDETTVRAPRITVTAKKITTITAVGKVRVGDYNVTMRTNKNGSIRLNIKQDNRYYSNDITIPAPLVDVVGDIFNAVKEAKEKEEVNG